MSGDLPTVEYQVGLRQAGNTGLSARGEDIMILAEHFVERGLRSGGPRISSFSSLNNVEAKASPS